MDWRDVARQKRLIATMYGGMPWHVTQLVTGLESARELYFDAISRVRMPRWCRGRVALLGDAAWGVTLGGMGVGTGIVGAYVLAGELAASGGDHVRAYAAYEQRMRRYAGRWQRAANPGQFLAPTSTTGLWLRNLFFSTKHVRDWMVASTRTLAIEDALPEYA